MPEIFALEDTRTIITAYSHANFSVRLGLLLDCEKQ
jgi:hypothetical protein